MRKISIDNEERIETGVVQFNDDWPGVFIRGDNALHFGHIIGNIISCCKDDKMIDFFDKMYLEQLETLLNSVHVMNNKEEKNEKDN